MSTRRQSYNSLKSYSDKNADNDRKNQPQVLKIKAVVVGDDQTLFGKGSLIEKVNYTIIKAVLESGETTNVNFSALVLAMNDAGLHQLVLFRNQATIEAAPSRMH